MPIREVQKQTAETAYLESNQLLLFAFAGQYFCLLVWRCPATLEKTVLFYLAHFK